MAPSAPGLGVVRDRDLQDATGALTALTWVLRPDQRCELDHNDFDAVVVCRPAPEGTQKGRSGIGAALLGRSAAAAEAAGAPGPDRDESGTPGPSFGGGWGAGGGEPGMSLDGLEHGGLLACVALHV